MPDNHVNLIKIQISDLYYYNIAFQRQTKKFKLNLFLHWF